MRRNWFLGILTVVLFSCSGSDDSGINPTPEPEPEAEAPVANNDAVSGVENEDLIISNLLDNDDLAEGARITSVTSTTAQGGSIVDNRNGSYTYKAPANFVGNDSFTYQLCLNSDTSICSTGTVAITIADAGTPIANDDEYGTAKNQVLVISDLVANDDLIDGAELTSVDDSSTTGQVVLNSNGTVSYTPAADFVGEDSFTYSICDNDTPSTCVSATVTVEVFATLSFNIPAELQAYYSTASFFENSDLTFTKLSQFTQAKHTTILTYFQRHEYLYDADADPSNSANVILMYTGESRDRREYTSGSNPHTPQTFNTEHIFPQSKLTTADAVTDLHHLRSADDAINSLRLNYPYVDGSGSYKLVNNNSWYPGDEWKGDVARMVLYLNIRYGEDYNEVGNLDLFLKWNREDPVSVFEKQRNNVIQGAQGNRNPFIDNPYLVTLIWGGTPAENTWE